MNKPADATSATPAIPVPAASRLPVRFFDGRSSRAQLAQAWMEGGQLRLQGIGVDLCVPLEQVRWPERTQRGPRVAQLAGGGSVQSSDAAAWDAWQRQGAQGDTAVVRMQQSWRAVFVSLSAVVLLMASGYTWGLPWLSREVAQRMPDSVEARVGEVVFTQLQSLTVPSELPQQVQRDIEQAWGKVQEAHRKAEAARGVSVRPTQLLLRHSAMIGPNALALPGGTMLLTDDMVRLLKGDQAAIVGVLGHELGHVQHRHGMRMLVQVSVLGAASSLLWGDFSGILSSVPLWLGQAHYSREAERESDAYSVGVLRAAGYSPLAMVTLFERLALYQRCGGEVLKEFDPQPQNAPPQAEDVKEGKEGQEVKAVEQGRKASSCKALPSQSRKEDKESAWGLGFASHPASQERIEFFRQAAR